MSNRAPPVKAASSNPDAVPITSALVTAPAAATRTSTSTARLSSDCGGYDGVTILIGDGTSRDREVTSFAPEPSVGVLMVGGRKTAATNTLESTGTVSSAGWKRQPRTAAVMTSVNGGDDRAAVISLTMPPRVTETSRMTSPPPTACNGICGSGPERYRAGTRPSGAATTIAAAHATRYDLGVMTIGWR